MAEAQVIEPEAPQGRGRRWWDSDVRRRFTQRKAGVIAAAWLALIALASFLGPLFTQDPNHADVTARLASPGPGAWFGTDHLGRDVLARVLAGGRISLIVIVCATTLAMFIGLVIGTLSGYRGGLLDDLLARIFDILVTFPTLLLGIIIVVAVGPSMASIIIAIAIGDMPLYGRLFRAGALSVRNREYVQGVVAIGIPHLRIILRHVIPNISIPVLVIAAGNMGRVALAEASLSFLGAGVQPPGASWGNMISQGQQYLQYAPWFPIIPGLVLTSVSVAFSFVGDALRDAFDLRESATAGADSAE